MFCLLSAVCYMFFFFQQKTAYEMLIGDSSSDVCSSDLMLCDVGFDIVRRRDRQSAALGRGLALKSRAPEVDDAGASRNIVAVYAGSVESGFCHVGVVECRGRDVAIQHDDFLHAGPNKRAPVRSEEHTSELQSIMRTSYAVFCLKKKKKTIMRDKLR